MELENIFVEKNGKNPNNGGESDRENIRTRGDLGVPSEERIARLIAYYLPQFHPTPENDLWWGRGFTEWTNVTNARPLFRGHVQPRLPADLGFYDLRVPEVREAQAELAKNNGIEGFCYWHYWLGNGRRILERPFQEVLASGEPDFPFCLAWANHDWTTKWTGGKEKMLLEQVYPGREDEEAHFSTLLPAFTDDRHIRVNGKPLFVVFFPEGLPDPIRFTDHWRDLAAKAGLPGIYFLGVADLPWDPTTHGFDAATTHPPGDVFRRFPPGWIDKVFYKLLKMDLREFKSRRLGTPKVYDYARFLDYALPEVPPSLNYFPCVLPDWDNTPRYGNKGVLLEGSTPELFGEYLESAIARVSSREADERIVFVKSWNEWAEGNYLEPDQVHGSAYLEQVRKNVFR